MDNIKWLTTGISELDISKFVFNPENQLTCKPVSGFWAAPYTPNEIYASDWVRWCNENGFATGPLDYGVVFKLKEDTRICVIDSKEDIEEFHIKYCRDYILEMREIDFRTLSEDYDGVFLTSRGLYLNYPFSTFYGWDCESLLLFDLHVIDKWESVNKLGLSIDCDF